MGAQGSDLDDKDAKPTLGDTVPLIVRVQTQLGRVAGRPFYLGTQSHNM